MTLHIDDKAQKWWLDNRSVVFSQTEAFQAGYTRAIADVVDWIMTDEEPSTTWENGSVAALAIAIENKFMKGDMSQKEENSNTSEKRVATIDTNELQDVLYFKSREVDEVKYKLGHKIEVLVSAIKESISRSDDSGDSYNSQPIRDVLKEIEVLNEN